MELLMIPLIIAITTGLIFLSKDIKYSIKLYILIAIDVLLILSILFRHYLDNILWIFAFFIIIVLIVISIFSSIIFLLKYHKKIHIINLSIPIISIILLFSNIHDKIAIKIELPKTKNKLEKILKDEYYENKDLEIDNGLYAFVYISGVVDNWVAIIYDNSGILENGIEMIENDKNFMKIENYQKIKRLFGGDIYSIKKIEENWYLCYFT
jgi:hypothetical protein